MLEPSSPTRSNNRLAWPLTAALVVWVAIAMAGWYCISAYGFSGDQEAIANAPQLWPAESTIVRTERRPTLLLFLHPKCPCSQVTVGELERLPVLVPNSALPNICVVAAAPRSIGDLWWSSSFLTRAARLPNAHLVRDPGGVETAIFGARVSGTVLLFDPAGNRLYAGGVTMARGHAGDNAGLQAVTDLLVDHRAVVSTIPPFGCELVRENRQSASSEPVSIPDDCRSLDESATSDDSHALSSPAAGGNPT